jgi:hypothetical protein
MKRIGLLLLLLALVGGESLLHASTSKSIRLQITNGVNSDEALLGFYNAALDEFDPYDSHKYSNDNPNYPELFFLASGEEVAINGVPTLIANKSLALGYRTGVAANLTIRITEFNNLDVGTTVLLRDNVLGVVQNMNLNPSYTFSSAIITTSTRFTLFIAKPLAKLVASDRAVSEQLGSAVAVSGDYAAVGNNPADSTGAVYLYKYTSGSWSQVQKLTASDISSNDHFGCAVAICGDWLVVGAYGEDEDAAGSKTLSTAGSVYIFKNDAGTWAQVQKIVASDRAAGDCFGQSVSISGSQIVVGAVNKDGGAGSAYVFGNTAGTWAQAQKIVASDRAAGDHFGGSVSISGKSLLVGAKDETEDASGGNTLLGAGSAYVFLNSAGTWSQTKKMVASDRAAGDHFGGSVSISGVYAVIGAADEDEDAAGANTVASAGSAYVFKNTAGTWAQAQKLVASDRAANDQFGASVAASGAFILVGAAQECEDVYGGNTLSSAGSAYLFREKTGTWLQNQKIIASDRDVNERFGSAVGFSGKIGIVGTPGDAHDAAGGNSLAAAGSATILRFDPNKRTWSGTSWGTTPTAADSAVVNGTYNGAGFSCLDLVVNAGKSLSVTSGLNVFGSLTLKSDASNGKSSLVDNGQSLFVATRVNVDQYLTGAGGSTTTGRFWYVSSPLKDATSAGFDLSSSNPLNKLWSFNESTVAYTPINTSLPLAPGYGYVARLGANKTVTLTGSDLNTGDQFIPVTRTGTTNTKRGFNLVGNPYPSYVELDMTDNPLLETTIWYRSLTSSGTSMVFDTYNQTSSTAVVASGSGTLTKYIPPMQAFWVKVATDGATGVQVVFRNAKRSQQTGVALRSEASNSVRLQLTDGSQTDETLIGFYPQAQVNFDAYDSHKLSNDNVLIPELYTKAGKEDVAINGLPSTELPVTLPLGIKIGQAGTFSIQLSENNETSILLTDKLLNITQNLLEQPTYTFTSAVTNTTDRFSLQIGKIMTELHTAQHPDFTAYVTIDRRIQVLNAGQASVTVFDTMGRIISRDPANQVFQSGMYIVRLTAAGFQAQKKVMVGR